MKIMLTRQFAVLAGGVKCFFLKKRRHISFPFKGTSIITMLFIIMISPFTIYRQISGVHVVYQLVHDYFAFIQIERPPVTNRGDQRTPTL